MNKLNAKILITCAFVGLLIVLSCVFAFVYAAEKTVYLDPAHGSDSYTGASASKAFKTLDKAISSAGSTNTTIVLVSDLSIGADYTEPAHKGKVTMTSGSYSSKVKFTNTSTAVYRLNGSTEFKNINISMTNYVIFAAQFNPIAFGESVSIENGSKYAFVVGGYEAPAKNLASNLNPSIRIDSGSFYRICGFARTRGEVSYTFTGTASITVNGGSIGTLYGASLYNHYSGSADITVNGGTIGTLYAGGDVTRRLEGDAHIVLNGGSVTTLDINNVIGNATVEIAGACPDAVSVSYANDTIKTAAEKAGSVKSVKYNAICCTESVIASFAEYFDTVENSTCIYVSQNGTGNGATASTAMGDFAQAYKKSATYGGTLCIIGNVTCSEVSFTGEAEPIRIVGYASGAKLSMPDGYSLELFGETVIDDVTLYTSGSARVLSHGSKLTVEDGVVTSGSISVIASTQAGADVSLVLKSGDYSEICGTNAAQAGKIDIKLLGGSASEIVCGGFAQADQIFFEMSGGTVTNLVSTNGSIMTCLTVNLRAGSVRSVDVSSCAGETILSVSAMRITNATCADIVKEKSKLIIGKGAYESDLAAILGSFGEVKHTNTLYVAEGGTGAGYSAIDPMSDLDTAIKALGGEGTIVICGKYTITATSYKITAHSYPITITSVDDSRDFRDVAYIELASASTSASNLLLGGETTFENFIFKTPHTNAFIYAMEHKLTIGDGVDTELTNANTNYINICGGSNATTGNGDADVTVNSGNWGAFRGGSTRSSTTSTRDSLINITINGGTFHRYFLCGSRGKVYGDINLTVNGGTFMQGIYGVYEEDSSSYNSDGSSLYSFDYDIVFDIYGGNFYSEISPARSKRTELHGTYTVYLRGGEFERLTDLCGSEAFSGDMTSELHIDPVVNIELEEDEEISFTNYLRRNNADPWLFYHDGYYYYTCTGATSVSLIKVANIADIQTASAKVILEPTEGVNMWSPEIHYFSEADVGKENAGWYLFIGYDDGTTANQRQYVAKCLDGDNLMGRWGNPVTGEVNVPQKVEFPDSPNTNNSALCGGMSVLRIGGKAYLTFVSEEDRGTADFHQTINITEFINPWTMKGTPTVICEPEYDWEAGGYGYSESNGSWYPKVVEGASAVYSDNGDVYLMYTGSGYWTIYYQLGYLKYTGSDPLDRSSWTKNPNSIFSLNDEINGCGHASYFKDHNGDYWACYHAYIGKDTSSKRFSFVERIYVTSEGVSIGNGSGHPAPLSTVYTMTANPMPLEDKISGFGKVISIGESDRVYTELSSAEDILNLMNNSNKWAGIYVLTRNIDLSVYTGELTQKPIGTYENPFTGSFDGAGYTISGINVAGSEAVGFFGVTMDAEIKNLTVSGRVTNNFAASNAESKLADGNYAPTGMLVGAALQGTEISGCTANGTSSGKGNVGGFVGMIYNTGELTVKIVSCTNNATVTNTLGNSGGLIARITSDGSAEIGAIIKDCTNNANLSSTSQDRCRIAGICGYISVSTNKIEFDGCQNNGTITATNSKTEALHMVYAGGIGGRFEIKEGADATVIIKGCVNTAKIESSSRAAGIVAVITRSADCAAPMSITNCYNSGNLTGTYVGGIVAATNNSNTTDNSVVLNCANYATITAKGSGTLCAGGILGEQLRFDIIGCYNGGKIVGNTRDNLGALVGVEKNNSSYVTENCYADASTDTKLVGYRRSSVCTHTNVAFVATASVGNKDSYNGFDFTEAWTIKDGVPTLDYYTVCETGDVDGDGILTNSDITLAIRYLSGWDIEYRVTRFDLNADTKLNNRDVIALIVKISE